MKGYIKIEKYDEVVNQYTTYKEEADEKIAALKSQLAELQRLIYGAKSERYVPEIAAEQLSLFEQQRQELLEQYTQLVGAHERKVKPKKKPARLKLPTHLKVVEEVLEPEVDTSGMVKIGVEETRTLAYTPARLYVKLLSRPKYVNRSKGNASDAKNSVVPVNVTSISTEQSSDQVVQDQVVQDQVVQDQVVQDQAVQDQAVQAKQLDNQGPVFIAPLPSRFIDKCIADESLLASILVDKYVDHLPLYRTQERIRRLCGMKIPRSTMSGWVGQSATKLQVLYAKLQYLVLVSSYLQIDETRMEVLPDKTEGGNKAKAPPKSNTSRGRKGGKNKKRKTHRGYLYGYLAMQEQLLFFEYDKTRTAANPLRHLKSYVGTIQTDCYDIYDQVRKIYAPHLTHYHCLNHARRNFEKALKNDAQRADHVLGQFQRLYAIEEVARKENWTTEKIYQVRQEQAKPILTALFIWMEIAYEKVLPSSSMGEAIAYMLKRKERMMHYLTDGKLHIDNNPIENAIRPIAVGRKNYLFAGSHQGAQWAAMFYSFFACCKIHEVDPMQWLEDIMRRLPEHPVNQIEQLLPHLWKPAS